MIKIVGEVEFGSEKSFHKKIKDFIDDMNSISVEKVKINFGSMKIAENPDSLDDVGLISISDYCVILKNKDGNIRKENLGFPFSILEVQNLNFYTKNEEAISAHKFTGIINKAIDDIDGKIKEECFKEMKKNENRIRTKAKRMLKDRIKRCTINDVKNNFKILIEYLDEEDIMNIWRDVMAKSVIEQ
jgi:hypothetical protein